MNYRMPSQSPYQRSVRTPRTGLFLMLIVGILFLGAIVVMVLKVVNTESGTRDTKNKAITQALKSASGSEGQKKLPDVGLALGAACISERQTLQDAENITMAINGAPKTVDQLVADHTINKAPAHLTVVLLPGGGYQIKPITPGTCT